MPTRRIWNQHSYHITNVNDDGTIPAVEQPSWLTHNTYRLNTFPDRHPRDLADLTVGALTVIDHGTAQPFSLRARIGNAGLLTPSEPVTVVFYQGDPAGNSVTLGTVTLAPLAGGSAQTVQLDGVRLSSTGDISAVVDPERRTLDCYAGNNSITVPLASTAPLGRIDHVTPDATAYGPQRPVVLTTTLTNTGSLPAAYSVPLRLEDDLGVPVVTFPPQVVTALAAGASTVLQQPWNTGTTLVGLYRVFGTLVDSTGRQLSEARAALAINADSTPLVALRTTTDRPRYHTSALVTIDLLVRNLTTNALFPGTTLHVQIQNPQGQEGFTAHLTVGDLVPQGQRAVATVARFQASPEGRYPVTTRLYDSAATLLATSQSTFEMVEDVRLTLTGSITAETAVLVQGSPQRCLGEVTNRGILPLQAQALRHLVLSMEREAIVTQEEFAVALPPAASQSFPRAVSTSALPAGPYACVLQAQIASAWQTLASATFAIHAPPVTINATLQVGPRGRVLVLLDAPGTGEDEDEDEDEDDRDDEGEDNDDEEETGPHGPTPPHAAPRAWLEALLTQKEWRYTITTTATSFTRAFREGGYTSYLLLAARVKLSEQVQDEIREAVYRGEGLIVARAHDQRNGRLQAPLGITIHGKVAAPQRLVLAASPLHPAGAAPLAVAQQAGRVEAAGATIAGTFGFAPTPRPAPSAVAVTRHAYGHGQAVYAGFALLAEATLAGGESLFASLLLHALTYVQPLEPPALGGSVLPVQVRLANQGIATPGQVVVLLPPATVLVETMGQHGVVLPQPDGTLHWLFTLAPGAVDTLTLWLRLPTAPGPLTLEAVVATGTQAPFIEQQRVRLPLTVVAAPTLAAVTARVPASRAYRQVREALSQAERELLRDRPEKALREGLKAAEELQRLATPEAAALRLAVAQLLRTLARQVVAP